MISKMNPLPETEDLVGMVFIMAEYIGRYMTKPGHIENMVSIQDVGGMGVGSMPKGKMKAILQSIATNYKGRAARIFAVNAPRTFTVLWQVVRFFIDANTARKVQIVNKNTCPELLEIVSPNQLEEKYGGTAPNRQAGDYWPPKLPDREFGVGGKTVVEAADKEIYLDNAALDDENEGPNDDDFQDCQ